MNTTIETERLTLRAYKESDAPFIYKNWASDPEVTKYLTWNPHESIEVTKAILARWLIEDKEAPLTRFCITIKGVDEPIGAIDLCRRDDGTADIGYCLSRAYWGRGIMTEACKAYINYLFDLGYEVLAIKANENNIGSNKVIKKCGFTFDHKETGPCSSFRPEIVTSNCYIKRK